jgi:hypothetical protein
MSAAGPTFRPVGTGGEIGRLTGHLGDEIRLYSSESPIRDGLQLTARNINRDWVAARQVDQSLFAARDYESADGVLSQVWQELIMAAEYGQLRPQSKPKEASFYRTRAPCLARGRIHLDLCSCSSKPITIWQHLKGPAEWDPCSLPMVNGSKPSKTRRRRKEA